ncbi:MAG: divalent metal cation transporter, partial [Pirellulales bacterium]|nr:divalent metal cation transporter [Pirellulales bacterium]
KHRGLAIFDLSIGLIVPFVLTTGCVVIAAASQFHGNPDDVMEMIASENTTTTEAKDYFDYLDKRLIEEKGKEFKATVDAAKDKQDPEHEQAKAILAPLRKGLPEADRQLAAMLAKRDNLSLAATLQPLVGSTVSQTLFGVGVLGMATSTIIILMLINGFAFCELLDVPAEGKMHRIGSFLPAVGVLGPFIWGKAAPALAVPTSVIGGAMLPIAYLSFLLLMNSRRTLGQSMPSGGKRIFFNIIMVAATGVAGFASVWGLINRKMFGFPIGNVALGLLGVLLLLGLIGFLQKQFEFKNDSSTGVSTD